MVFGTKRRFLISAISFLTPIIFCTLILNPASSITQESSQRLDFTFEPTVQITLSSSTLLVSDLALNTYSDSNTINILAGTNVTAGMQLTATVGSVNNPTSNLVQTGTTDVFRSIATDANLANLGEAEGTNIWGYSYKNSNTETWENYNGLPTYDATGALLLNTSDVTNSTINFKIAAKAGGTQALGSYTNSINFSAVAKVITTNYAINFLNGGNDVTNWPTNVSGSDTTGQGTTVTLGSLVPDKVGYDFAGWCTVSTNDGSCTGNVYQPGDSYPIGAVGDTVTVNLYAMWGLVSFDEAYAAAGKIKYSTNNGDYYAMQDMTPDICTNVGDGQVGTLIDTRGTDKQTYTVAKLADGKCWMTENLNIAGGTALSADDTDVTSTYISGFTNQANLTKSGNTITLPASATAGFNNDSNAFVYNNSGNKTNCGGLNQNTQCYSYYSWIAATLGGKQANGSTAVANYYNAAASICPKGWKLPTSTTSNASATSSSNWKTGDWYALAKAYGANLESNYYDNSSATGANFYNNAGPVNNSIPNFLLAGYYYPGSFNGGGSYGDYWSSTSYSSTNAYNLSFGSSSVGSAYSANRRYGFSVRCLAKDTTIDDLTYMQDFAALSSDTKTKVISSMDTEKTYTLKDKRDEQDYTIAKLNDGKVWMIENLNLAGGTALSADDTDVTSTYISGFTNQANLTKSGNTITLPASATAGFNDDGKAFVYNSGNETGCGASSQNTPCYSYYSWIAATLGGKQANGSTAQNGNGYNAAASICPKGWRLPTSTTSNASVMISPNWKTGDWYALAKAYEANLESNYYDSSSATGANFYNNAGPVNNSIPNFLLAGHYFNGSFGNGGSYGFYWSSTSGSSPSAYYLYFNSSRVHSAGNADRRYGFSVRCLLNSGE